MVCSHQLTRPPTLPTSPIPPHTETSEESEEDRADLARINSLLERPPRRDLGIRAQPSTAVPMPSDELASGHTTPHKQARSSLPPAADTDAAAAVAAEAAPAADGAAMSGPFAEPSIEDVVPALASIPPPPAQEQEQEPPEPKVSWLVGAELLLWMETTQVFPFSAQLAGLPPMLAAVALPLLHCWLGRA